MQLEVMRHPNPRLDLVRAPIITGRFPRVRAMNAMPACPHCGGGITYPDGDNLVCAECGHEWPAVGDTDAGQAGAPTRDSNGNILADGDNVVVIKDLKVRGSSIPLKQGTMIRGIRLVEDDPEHIEGNSDKIKGLVLKSCFLRKA
jgi:protein PhnA